MLVSIIPFLLLTILIIILVKKCSESFGQANTKINTITDKQKIQYCKECRKAENTGNMDIFCTHCDSGNLDLNCVPKSVNLNQPPKINCISKDISLEKADKLCNAGGNYTCSIYDKNSELRVKKGNNPPQADYMNKLCGDDYFCGFNNFNHCGTLDGLRCSPTNEALPKTGMPPNNMYISEFDSCVCGTPLSERNKPIDEQKHYVCYDKACTQMSSVDITKPILDTPDLHNFLQGYGSYMNI